MEIDTAAEPESAPPTPQPTGEFEPRQSPLPVPPPTPTLEEVVALREAARLRLLGEYRAALKKLRTHSELPQIQRRYAIEKFNIWYAMGYYHRAENVALKAVAVSSKILKNRINQLEIWQHAVLRAKLALVRIQTNGKAAIALTTARELAGLFLESTGYSSLDPNLVLYTFVRANLDGTGMHLCHNRICYFGIRMERSRNRGQSPKIESRGSYSSCTVNSYGRSRS